MIMISISENVKSYFFLAKDSTNYNDDLYKLCFELVQSGKFVLLLTLARSRYDLLPLSRELNFSKELLKRFIIIYFRNIEALTRKLLELWTLQPDFLVVDLGQSRPFKAPTSAPPHASFVETETFKPPDLQSICLCIASLFSFMEALRRRQTQSKTGQTEAATAAATCPNLASLFVLSADVVELAQVELLINLYYYKKNAFDDFDKFKAKLLTDK